MGVQMKRSLNTINLLAAILTTGLIAAMSVGEVGAQSLMARVESGERAAGNIRAIQELLAENGYDPGPVDGQMGPATRRALAQWKKAEGLSVSLEWTKGSSRGSAAAKAWEPGSPSACIWECQQKMCDVGPIAGHPLYPVAGYGERSEPGWPIHPKFGWVKVDSDCDDLQSRQAENLDDGSVIPTFVEESEDGSTTTIITVD